MIKSRMASLRVVVCTRFKLSALDCGMLAGYRFSASRMNVAQGWVTTTLALAPDSFSLSRGDMKRASQTKFVITF